MSVQEWMVMLEGRRERKIGNQICRIGFNGKETPFDVVLFFKSPDMTTNARVNNDY